MRRAWLIVAVALVGAWGQLGAAGTAAPRVLGCTNPRTITWDRQTNPYAGIEALPHATWADVWTQQGAESIKWCAFDDWIATARQDNSPETGVKAFPDSEFRWTDNATCASQPTLGSFRKLKSTFGHIGPSSGSWDAAWDWFLDGGQCNKPLTEVMWFTEWRAVSLPNPQLSTTIDGVPVDIYYAPFTAALLAERLYHRPAATISPAVTGGYYVQIRQKVQTTAGDINWKHVFNYLYTKGLVSPTTTAAFAKYGFEILSTCADPIPAGCHGKKIPFQLTGFTVKETIG